MYMKLNGRGHLSGLITSATLILSTFVSPVQAIESNFNYSGIGVSVSRTDFSSSVETVDGDKFDNLLGFAAGGQHQIDGGPYFGATGGYGFNNQDNSELRLRSLEGYIGLPIAIGSRVDVSGEIGYVWQEYEFCFRGDCETDADTAVQYGIGARGWIVPERLEVGLSWQDATISDSVQRTTLEGALWSDANNRFGLRFTDRRNDGHTIGAGYTYSW